MTEQLQTKLSWKLGNIELHYEGNESFLKNELPQLFRELLEIYKSDFAKQKVEQPELPIVIEKEKQVIEPPTEKKQGFDVNTIAAKLQMDGRKNLVMAACLYLALVEGNEVFSRDQILEAMKTATQFYSDNSKKSLSQYIISLTTQGYLLERGQDVYAIAGGKMDELQAILAGERVKDDSQHAQLGSKKSSKTEKRPVRKPPKIDLEKFDTDNTDDTPSLHDFFFQRIPGKPHQKDRVVLIAYYIQRIKNLQSFSEGNIDYGYKILGITDRPAHIYQMLVDNRNAFGWFEKSSDGKGWNLLRPGEIYVEKLPVQQDKQ